METQVTLINTQRNNNDIKSMLEKITISDLQILARNLKITPWGLKKKTLIQAISFGIKDTDHLEKLLQFKEQLSKLTTIKKGRKGQITTEAALKRAQPASITKRTKQWVESLNINKTVYLQVSVRHSPTTNYANNTIDYKISNIKIAAKVTENRFEANKKVYKSRKNKEMLKQAITNSNGNNNNIAVEYNSDINMESDNNETDSDEKQEIKSEIAKITYPKDVQSIIDNNNNINIKINNTGYDSTECECDSDINKDTKKNEDNSNEEDDEEEEKQSCLIITITDIPEEFEQVKSKDPMYIPNLYVGKQVKIFYHKKVYMMRGKFFKPCFASKIYKKYYRGDKLKLITPYDDHPCYSNMVNRYI
jgi:hypothetical protein